MDRGAVCFLGSIGDESPGALTWLAFGNCYVKGMGLEYLFPEKTAYGVNSLTLPEYRRKGLYLHLNQAIVDYSNKNNIDDYYVLVEFVNVYTQGIIKKLGFSITHEITFFSFLFLFSEPRLLFSDL